MLPLSTSAQACLCAWADPRLGVLRCLVPRHVWFLLVFQGQAERASLPRSHSVSTIVDILSLIALSSVLYIVGAP